MALDKVIELLAFPTPIENSLLRYVSQSEDKAMPEEYLTGRSRKKSDKSSPAHYALHPALQMEVSMSTSSSDSASLYHVSPIGPRPLRQHWLIQFVCCNYGKLF